MSRGRPIPFRKPITLDGVPYPVKCRRCNKVVGTATRKSREVDVLILPECTHDRKSWEIVLVPRSFPDIRGLLI